MSMWTRLLDLTRGAARRVRRRRGPSLAFVALVALGVGLNAGVFALVRGAFLRDLPFPQSDRLVAVWETEPARGQRRNVVGPSNFMRWRESLTSFESLAGFIGWTVTIGGSEGAERAAIGYVTGEFFRVLGVTPQVGRLIGAEDAAEGRGDVVVLSDGLWRRRFGADPAIVGRAVLVEGTPRTVLGVAPARLDLPTGVELWEPIVLGERHRQHGGRYLSVVGRLRPGVTVAAAQAELDLLVPRLAAERPELNTGWAARVVAWREDVVGPVRLGFAALLLGSGTLLAVGCLNLLGLGLAHGLGRRRELAVRSALGAGTGRLAAESLAEATLLGLVGAVSGLVLARFVLAVFLRGLPADLPGYLEFSIDPLVAGVALGVALLAAAIVGTLPSWILGRIGGWRTTALRGGASVPRALRASHLLVAGEVALAMLLACGAALLGRNWATLKGIDPGFSTDGLWAARIDLPSGTYGEPAAVARFFGRLETEAAGLPGVVAAGAISWLPLGGPGAATSVERPGRQVPGESQTVADVRVVTPGFLEAAGVRLATGRGFDGRDVADAPRRAVVSESLVRELFGAEDPIGQKLLVRFGATPDAEIVGVVPDLRIRTVSDPVRPLVFFAQAQVPSNFLTVVLRLPPGVLPPTAELRAAARRIDPQVPVSAVRSFEAIVAGTLRAQRFTSALFGSFGAAALGLAGLGIFGVLAAAVARRRRELGVRLALGARPAEVSRLVVATAARWVLGGAAVGLAAAALAGRAFSALLGAIPWWDPVAFATAAAVLAVATLSAALLPARRAARLDPAAVLREE